VTELERRHEIVELAQGIVASREEGSESLRTLLPKCHRLCKLAEYEELSLWTDLEMQGLTSTSDRIKLESGNDVQRAARERFRRTRTITSPISGAPRVHLLPAHGLELHAETLRSKDNEISHTELVDVTMAIEQIKDEVHRVACNILMAYAFGDAAQTIFEDARATVDRLLPREAPDTLQQFQAAEQRLVGEPTSEELSQAANSLDLAFRKLADALYPPRDEKVKELEVTQDKHINRLKVWARERAEHESAERLIEANIEHLEDRLKKLYKLTNQGRHDAFTIHEARMCFIQSYLLVADLLQLGQSTGSGDVSGPAGLCE